MATDTKRKWAARPERRFVSFPLNMQDPKENALLAALERERKSGGSVSKVIKTLLSGYYGVGMPGVQIKTPKMSREDSKLVSEILNTPRRPEPAPISSSPAQGRRPLDVPVARKQPPPAAPQLDRSSGDGEQRLMELCD